MTHYTKTLKAILIASSPLIISAESAMAQIDPGATFAAGCNGSADSVVGTITQYLDYLKAGTPCQVRDKIYTITEAALADFAPDDTVLQIAQSTFNPFSHSIKLSNVGGFQPGPFDFNYNVSVVSGSNLYIKEWFTSAEPVAPAPTSGYTVATTANATSGSVVFPGTGITSIISLPGTPTSVDFTNLVTVDSLKAGPNGFTNTITQAPFSSKVPGPLPLLGAGAAFGFSRKLRARIKSIA